MKDPKTIKWVLGGLVVAVVLAAFWFASSRGPETAPGSETPSAARPPAVAQKTSAVAAPARTPASAERKAAAAPAVEDEGETPPTEEERREAEEEARVEAFDALTDKWMEPSPKGVTMADVDQFVRQLAKVPRERREECLQRALNLVPDENVMLLVGVLMDKSQSKELVELVYNDILNRDEDVKKPILQQVFKDKTHPCWADTAWILDVTGEKK